ncbi:MAG: Uncharacterized membrane protein, YraQ family, partial [uncultured Thermomicrobiales bacterium]
DDPTPAQWTRVRRRDGGDGARATLASLGRGARADRRHRLPRRLHRSPPLPAPRHPRLRGDPGLRRARGVAPLQPALAGRRGTRGGAAGPLLPAGLRVRHRAGHATSARERGAAAARPRLPPRRADGQPGRDRQHRDCLPRPAGNRGRAHRPDGARGDDRRGRRRAGGATGCGPAAADGRRRRPARSGDGKSAVAAPAAHRRRVLRDGPLLDDRCGDRRDLPGVRAASGAPGARAGAGRVGPGVDGARRRPLDLLHRRRLRRAGLRRELPARRAPRLPRLRPDDRPQECPALRHHVRPPHRHGGRRADHRPGHRADGDDQSVDGI